MIHDTAAFWAMWKTVTTRYAHNRQVYFEPMNEPYGYSKSEWADIAARALSESGADAEQWRERRPQRAQWWVLRN